MSPVASVTSKWLEPGPHDPHSDASPSATAEHYGVPVARVHTWLTQGLPQTREGLLNPFEVCNWLSHGRLHEAPALAWRWRSYLRWFAPFVEGRDQLRRLRWTREHRLYLPQTMPVVERWLPSPQPGPGLLLHSDYMHGMQRRRAGALRLWYRQDRDLAAGEHLLSGSCEVSLFPRPAAGDMAQRDPWLYQQCREFVGDFAYGYRRHRRDRTGLTLSKAPGSCLDCALLLQEQLQSAGRPASVVGGIIAHNDLSNPHFWLEVATVHGPVPVDPSIPAIARMLGADWQRWLAAYVGGCDARRIPLTWGMSALPGVEPHTFNWSIGETMVTAASGQRYNAWPCLDWVCGECRGQFDTVSGP